MSLLFGRAWQIFVGNVDVSNLDATFEARRSLRAEPNTCTLRLFNLAPTTAGQIQQQAASTGTIPVSIQAGYQGTVVQIYAGQLRAAVTVTDGPDTVLELNTGDGESAMAQARVNIAIAAGTPYTTVFAALANQLGLGLGNVASAKLPATWSSKGCVLKGNVADYISDTCKANGLEWSIQNGAIQVLPLGGALAGQAALLTTQTGLVGSPSVDSKGVLKACALIQPGVTPGATVAIKSSSVNGQFRCIAVDFEGDTLGNPWYAKLEGQLL